MAYHELRSCLGLVATAARSVAEENVDERIRRRCDAIERATQRLLRTTHNVLNIANRAAFSAPRRFSPADEVELIVADLHALGLHIECAVQQDGPQPEVRLSFEVFETLVQSLICNAMDHSPEGATTRVSVTTRAGVAIIEIRNPVPTERRHSGLGIGSYLTSRLAELLEVELTTTADDGTFVARIVIPHELDRLPN